MAISNKIILVFIIICIVKPAYSGEVNILGSTYFIGSLIKEISLPIPTGLEYSLNKTLVFIRDDVREYLNSNLYSFELLLNYKKKPASNTVFDSQRNRLFFNKKQLYLKDKNRNQKGILLPNNDVIKEFVLNKAANEVFILGVNSKTAAGVLYALNTNQPHKVKEKIQLQTVSAINEIKAISMDQTTGDIAILKNINKDGWKIILLSKEKSRIKYIDDDEGEKKSSNEIIPVDTGSKKIVKDFITQATAEIVSNCHWEAKPLQLLEGENRSLKNELKFLKKRIDYLLRRGGTNYEVTNEIPKINKESVDLHENSFENFVNKSRKRLLDLIDDNVILWRDKIQCDKVFSSAPKTRKCGAMRGDPIITQELPGAVQILGVKENSTSLYTFNCFGVLIHPNVIIATKDGCRVDENELRSGKYIGRIGKFSNKFVKNSVTDIQIISSFENFYKGTKLLHFFVLKTPFESDKVACFPTQQIFINTGTCYAVYQNHAQAPGKIKVEKLQASKFRKCHKDFFEPSDGFFCIRNLRDCIENFHVTFCPLMDDPYTYVVTSLRYYTFECEEVSLDLFRMTALIERVMEIFNYDMSEYFA